jgi:D-alanine transaminase
MTSPESELLFLNGELMPLSQGRVPVEDRGFQFADGVYEVVRVLNGRPFRLEAHLKRLARSARGLEMELAYEAAEMARVCRELVERSGLGDGIVYVQVTRGTEPRSHLPKSKLRRPTTLAHTRLVPRCSAEDFDAGQTAVTKLDDRWDHCDLKSICLLPNVLGKIEANRHGADEVIYHGPDRTVYEGGSSNVYGVIGGEVFTHPNGPKILDGVTRRAILEVCETEGIPCHESPRTLEDFLGAEETFLTSSTRDARPLLAIDGQRIGNGRPGPVTRQISEAYLRLLDRETRETP